MRLFTQLEYMELLTKNATKVVLEALGHAAALDYAGEVWNSLELPTRALKNKDVSAVFQHGKLQMIHIKAFSRKMPDTFVIVIAGKEIEGHILIDLAAEYSEPSLFCPSCDFDGLVKLHQIESMIKKIQPEDQDPFAVLQLADGTYMQTYRESDGFCLEYQLVNTSSHYTVPELVTQSKVISAMKSYASGDRKWMSSFAWEKQDLSS